MAQIGMKHAYAAVVTAETGSSITYSTGFSAGYSVSANVSFDTNDTKDYGDDVVLDSDNGVNGFTVEFETNDIAPSVRANLLGWGAIQGGLSTTDYMLTDDAAPTVGFGYMQHMRTNGVDSYDTYWFYKVRFRENTIAATTKEESIAWGHKTITGTGEAWQTTNSNAYCVYARHASEASALAWLKSKANVT